MNRHPFLVVLKVFLLLLNCNIPISKTEQVCSNTTQSLVISITKENAKIYHHNAKIVVCTPSRELHSLACKVIESILIKKGFKVINTSPSVATESIISYLKDIRPNVIFISITPDENINAGRTLIKKIRSIFPSILRYVGGKEKPD